MSFLISRAKLRRTVLATWHSLLRAFLGKQSHGADRRPKRILLVNGAHMGDVVIATSLLPVLKSAYPNAEIGFLTATWSYPVIRNHPAIAYTHRVDHWRMNRSTASFLQKCIQYWRTRRRALQELRSYHYDLAICMHPWRADFLPLCYQAGISKRVAFSESWFAPMATVLADYPDQRRFIHQSDCQLELLRAIGIEERHLEWRRASLGPSSAAAVKDVCYLLGFSRIDDAPYSVIHMGAGIPAKELPSAFWAEIATRLTAGQLVLFTGKGAREWTNAAEAMAGLENCVNACDHLSWDALVAAIRHAHAFYGVDSMAAHVAAAVGTRCVAMYAGMSNPARFRPDTQNGLLWTNAVPCSGCDRQFGCGDMTCMSGFDPDQIVQIDVPKRRAARAV